MKLLGLIILSVVMAVPAWANSDADKCYKAIHKTEMPGREKVFQAVGQCDGMTNKYRSALNPKRYLGDAKTPSYKKCKDREKDALELLHVYFSLMVGKRPYAKMDKDQIAAAKLAYRSALRKKQKGLARHAKAIFFSRKTIHTLSDQQKADLLNNCWDFIARHIDDDPLKAEFLTVNFSDELKARDDLLTEELRNKRMAFGKQRRDQQNRPDKVEANQRANVQK